MELLEKIYFFLKENLRLIIGAAVVAFFVILILVITLSKTSSVTKTKVTISNKTFNVFVAKSDIEKQIGLSSKKEISENQGMLFLFDKPDFYAFWMKEMKFPIDIVYIENNKVTSIISNVKPPTNPGNLPIYKPQKKADMVIEINAGLATKYNFHEGSSVKIENL